MGEHEQLQAGVPAMSWHHFVRRSRRVKLGGRVFGPLCFGGGWYTVGPISTMRMVQLLDLVGSMRLQLGDEPLDAIFQRAPLMVVAMAASILVKEPIRPRHLARVTPEQVEALAEALGQVNDLPYCFQGVTGEGGNEHPRPLAAALVDLAFELHCQPRDLWLLPWQEVLAIMDARANRSESGAPVNPARLSDEQKETIRMAQAAGFRVTYA